MVMATKNRPEAAWIVIGLNVGSLVYLHPTIELSI